MKKSEIFDIVLAEVAAVCEVSADDIINIVRRQDVVDARVLVVQYLRRIGLSFDDIAVIVLRRQLVGTCFEGSEPTERQIKSKARGVQKMFCSYTQRCLESRAFRLMSIEVRDFLLERFKDMEN